MKNDIEVEVIEISDIEALLPYDDNYPAQLLSINLNKMLRLADAAVERINLNLSKYAPDIAQAKKTLTKDFRFVLDVSDDVKKKIANGELKLTVENNGKMYAQFRNNGRYGDKIPIKREDFGGEFDPVQMANAMQMRAIQTKLEDMSNQLMIIDDCARGILQGQQNDRIAMYYSGLSLYLEAKNISDDLLRKQLIAQSLRALNEATYQLDLTLKSDIEYLALKEYEKHKKQGTALIDEKIKNINQSFKFIHQSYLLRAGIFCEQGELTAMTAVIGEYSKFISDRIAKNAILLSECDTSDKGLDDTGWKARANFKIDIADISRQISQKDKVIYLVTEEKDND